MSTRDGSDASATARRVAGTPAAREQGRRRLNAATATVTVASVAAVAGVIAILPGTSHASTGHSSGSSSDSANPDSANPDNGTSSQGGLQQPRNAPQGGGSGPAGSTSGPTW
jgi:hypothetical protein